MTRSRFAIPCAAILAVTALCTVPSSAIADGDPTPADSCASTGGFETGFCTDAHNDSVATAANRRRQHKTPGRQPSGSSSSLDAQRAQQTAEQTTSPEAPQGWSWDLCVLKSIGKEANSRIPSDYDCTPASPDSGAAYEAPGRAPTTEEILYAAAAVIHADGAGLHKRPSRTSYTNKYVPTIVAATNPTQTHVVTMFGREITVTFTATSYEWDWGDGTPNTITAYQGMAFEKGMDPNKDPRLIRHYYTPPNGWRSRFDGPYPDATRTITLTTTWSGTATNPFTGETQTINGLVTTTETTGPFPLNHLLVSNTDTWEEKQGH